MCFHFLSQELLVLLTKPIPVESHDVTDNRDQRSSASATDLTENRELS